MITGLSGSVDLKNAFEKWAYEEEDILTVVDPQKTGEDKPACSNKRFLNGGHKSAEITMKGSPISNSQL